MFTMTETFPGTISYQPQSKFKEIKGDAINGLQSGIKVEEGKLFNQEEEYQQSEKNVTGKVKKAAQKRHHVISGEEQRGP